MDVQRHSIGGLELNYHMAGGTTTQFVPPNDQPWPNTITVDDILASLERRGFYGGIDYAAVRVQFFAVQEELGEIARMIRRNDQGVTALDVTALASEAADVVIAAVCLLGACAGHNSWRFVDSKLRSDELRGWRHNGNHATTD